MVMMMLCLRSLAGDKRSHEDAEIIAVKMSDAGRLRRHLRFGADASSPSTK